jgi:hypothetical protein
VNSTRLDEGSQLAVRMGVAQSMLVNVSSVAITDISMADDRLRSRLLSLSGGGRSLQVSTTTSVSTKDFPDYARNASGLFALLTTRFVEAIESGNFSSSVRRASIALGANSTAQLQDVVLTYLSPASIAYPPTAAPTPGPSSEQDFKILASSSSGDTVDSLTIGVAVGVSVGALLVCMVSYLLMRHRASSTTGDAGFELVAIPEAAVLCNDKEPDCDVEMVADRCEEYRLSATGLNEMAV